MKKKFITLGICGLILAGLFCWFEVRPSLIKHECSWVKKHEDAVPERPAMTETELREKGILETCSDIVYPEPPPGVIESLSAYSKRMCKTNNERKIEEYKEAKPAKPARDWFEKSTDAEYKFCLRDKGL